MLLIFFIHSIIIITKKLFFKDYSFIQFIYEKVIINYYRYCFNQPAGFCTAQHPVNGI